MSKSLNPIQIGKADAIVAVIVMSCGALQNAKKSITMNIIDPTNMFTSEHNPKLTTGPALLAICNRCTSLAASERYELHLAPEGDRRITTFCCRHSKAPKANEMPLESGWVRTPSWCPVLMNTAYAKPNVKEANE